MGVADLHVQGNGRIARVNELEGDFSERSLVPRPTSRAAFGHAERTTADRAAQRRRIQKQIRTGTWGILHIPTSKIERI